MEITYTLYFVMMEELRDMIKSFYSTKTPMNWVYLYTDLTHVVDIDRFANIQLPRNVIAEIEFSYMTNTLFYGNRTHIKRILIKENATFIPYEGDEVLNSILNQWMEKVVDRYYTTRNKIDRKTSSPS